MMMKEICCVIVEKDKVKNIKTHLEKCHLLHKDFRISKFDCNHMAIPVSFKCFPSKEEHLREELSFCGDFRIHYMDAEKLSSTKVSPPRTTIINFCKSYLKDKLNGLQLDEVLREIPHKWEIHGDMALFSKDVLQNEFWSSVDADVEFWTMIADLLHVKRVGLISRITNDDFRTPQVELKLGVDGWVEHVDNGVVYVYDVTKCMFSKGNITEKLRISSFDCKDEVVLDLFAGIGYFSIPFLMKAGAKKLIACEWNPDSVAALKKGLELNRVLESRYEILQGDNRKVAPKNIADRVNLGLVPTSSMSWKVACEALNGSTGGWLHIHENVDSGANQQGNCTCHMRDSCLVETAYKRSLRVEKRLVWCSFIARMEKTLLSYLSDKWVVSTEHVEHVKSYAPHVDHVVFDVLCRPPTYPAYSKDTHSYSYE